MRLNALSRIGYACCVCLLAVIAGTTNASGHGLAGQRFFPTTFTVDDPFVSDEFSLLYNFLKLNGPDGGSAADSSALSVDAAKRIAPAVGLSVGGSYERFHVEEGETTRGYGNVETGFKYQFYTSSEHETILAAGVSAEVGGTGTRAAGADTFTTVSPALFFGKGLGGLPDSAKFLRPVAITGVVGPNFPMRARTVAVDPDTGDVEVEEHPMTLTWGVAFQYNLQYLQNFVQDVGLGAPFGRMAVVVEFPMETCLSRGCGDGTKTTGTVNPGIVWFGKYTELGLAAQIPVNPDSGKDVGVLALLHFFIDDLFPNSFGRPIVP